ncbi:DUF4305 domain-containing protein [Peribacillus cavernae]|uniref:DUF4305 domain-containing protein n=1 Tax=Peribacillus cavernae TaxID=1674310 RepID=A0A3S0TYG9_9BACI|nr:YdiK family protein [Peribacillus cavernae]MDQ0221372.1 hypothetical protein [Peribacillus cavernae]RUQ27515.1 DUF4305 domain-containing protein [Peribacillus cavernae]
MRRSPITAGFFYMALGVLFTVFAVQEVSSSGWGFLSYVFVLLATLDFGSGIRMVMLHLKIKSSENKKK